MQLRITGTRGQAGRQPVRGTITDHQLTRFARLSRQVKQAATRKFLNYKTVL
jgi:hypothetical protein